MDSKKLCDITVDFRDLLANIDRKRFHRPFVPSVLYRELGDDFSFKRWRRVLKKHRVTLKIRENVVNDSDISADANPGDYYINVVINYTRRVDDIYQLKYDILQIIMHEMVHINQFFSHDNQYTLQIDAHELEQEDYLSRFGEIQAYAHHCAIDFMEQGKWGVGYTYDSYKGCSKKVKSMLNKQIVRWLNKYNYVQLCKIICY